MRHEEEIIKVEKLSKSFGDFFAVDQLSFEVEKGEIYGIVGPDGSGKTTTMRLLTTIMDPSSGSAWIDGKNISTEAKQIKNEIGYMSQRFGLYPDLTVLENIYFYADIFEVPRKKLKSKLDELFDFSNLGPFKDRLAGRLSGGMKQKLGLCCALVHTPKVLFLDEPTNGVDPVSRRDFWNILYEMQKQKVTILISTSYLDEAERCNRLGLLYKGHFISHGTPRKVKEEIQEEVLEIRCESPKEGVRLLREDFQFEKVGLSGRSIHLLTDQVEKAQSIIEKRFQERQFPFQEIRQVNASLEDVFISKILKEENG